MGAIKLHPVGGAQIRSTTDRVETCGVSIQVIDLNDNGPWIKKRDEPARKMTEFKIWEKKNFLTPVGYVIRCICFCNFLNSKYRYVIR